LLAANISYADDALLRGLDGGRSGLALWPGRYDGGTRLLGVDLPLADQRNADQPPGRAVLVQEDDVSIVQIAIC
jgi:S-DNA-T family DNA segregation ATPase FtsK/SpoIIIE